MNKVPSYFQLMTSFDSRCTHQCKTCRFGGVHCRADFFYQILTGNMTLNDSFEKPNKEEPKPETPARCKEEKMSKAPPPEDPMSPTLSPDFLHWLPEYKATPLKWQKLCVCWQATNKVYRKIAEIQRTLTFLIDDIEISQMVGVEINLTQLRQKLDTAIDKFLKELKEQKGGEAKQ